MRNLGGRKEIVNRLNSHYDTLNKIKPTMNTRGSKKAAQGNFKSKQDLTEVTETFKRIQNVKKSQVDHSMPETFGVSSKLSAYKMRKKNAIKDEHAINMQHMQRRIKEIGSLNDRKKNPWDCVMNPPYMFRHTSESGVGPNGVYALAKTTSTTDVDVIRKKESNRRRPRTSDPSNVMFIKKELLERIIAENTTDYLRLEDLFFEFRQQYPAQEVEEAISYVKKQLG